MTEESPANRDSGIDAQQLTLDFAGEKFTTSDSENRKQWIASAVRIAERKAKTRDIVSLILIIAFVSSFPALVLALYAVPDMKQEVITGFTQWLTVIGSLSGAAVGVGALADRKNS